MKRKKKYICTGFSLVEILTVMAVVAILLAILIPALSSIEKTALNVRQHAQFHSIGVALEAFLNDMGDYPPSAWDTNDSDGNGTYYGNYTASQRLAEALVGRDGFGFHPASEFRGDGKADIDGDGTLDIVYDTTPQNLAARKGPYLELENANAVLLSNLYGAGKFGVLDDSYVLADMYKYTKNLASGKLTGSPVLYYRANRGKIQHDESYANVNPALNQCTYNIHDSIGELFKLDDSIADLTPLSTKTGSHPLVTSGRQLFYRQTINPNFPGASTYPASGTPPRPYRADSFILQSAGPDGLYGTPDDVFNFDQEK